MKHLYRTLSIAVALLAAMPVASQSQNEPLHCGTDPATQQLYAQFPGLAEEAATNHARMLEEGKRNLAENRSATPPTYIIPVVFHIVHDYGIENISDAQVVDAVMHLNLDFRKQNADTSQIVAPFTTLAADAEIEFRLAQLDPNGNCTNGIDRVQSMETYVGDDGSKLNPWPRDRYLNIWVVRETLPGIAGYSYSPATTDPATMDSLDGILMLHSYVGSIGTGSPLTTRFLTHETGHWLALLHLFGTGTPNVACGDDGILDTPVTQGWTNCQLVNNDECNSGTPENVQNFMENSWCQRMFTPGQCAAMHYALNSAVSARNNLWTTANLTATGVLNPPTVCVPHADFKADRRMHCEGSSILLYDQSSHTMHDTSYCSWTVSGPITDTSTQRDPVFSNLNVPGWYDVTLVVSNSAGADTLTRTNYLLVGDDTASLTPFQAEDFETPGVFYLGYTANDRYGNGSVFHQVNYVGNSGSGSVALNTFGNSSDGDVDELITPPYFVAFNTGLQISFAYAYATAATSTALNTQELKLYTSADCGESWQLRWTASGPSMVTAGYYPTAFVPSPAEWDTITVNLPASNSRPTLRFKFEFTAPADSAGNNLFIDDINITWTNVGIDEPAATEPFIVYPNPGDGNGTIAYTLPEPADVVYSVYDLSGRLLSTVDAGQQAAGNYAVPVSEATLAPGTYFIAMRIGEEVSVQKYVVAE